MEFHNLIAGVQNLRKIGQRTTFSVAKKADAAFDAVNDVKKSLCRYSKVRWNEIMRRTKREPFTAHLIATGTGVVVGWLIGRDRR
jgi:hypothetical protein